MNQILVTKKLYITPELKRKKKIYKFDFIISVFLVCVLTSLYIYAEYDRNKSEQTSQQLLTEVNETLSETEDTTIAKDDVLLIVLDGTEDDYVAMEEREAMNIATINEQAEKKVTSSGYTYRIIATITIPEINLTYPVLQGETGSTEEIDDLLKISPCKYHGGEPNEKGNFCIVGHNYRNRKFFSKVPTLGIGSVINLTDLTGRTISYEVYDKHTVDPTDTRDTTQLTGGKKEITLITCTDDSKQRVIVKAKEIK